ncbi:MAG: flagellar hook protein FlgE [Sulfurospirillaceae bacterium]|nr:flagellar hook protein FlgE [Sulfurospirillaceae bacterium]
MMRSLWAGVSGLQSHQIAMDVEGNNIANVNTTGFKYSRANFADLLSQTSKIATAPQGALGGKNPMQVGLGTQVSSVTKIFKQGSIQTTDKNTDLAIQGDGFFIISPDSGNTYKFSRNGDFTFDADGNFTDSNGYIVQGWVRDEGTGDIDATTPIGNITIPPGLTTPANDTGYITLKANLNSGNTVSNRSPIYQLDSNNRGYDFDSDGVIAASEVINENSNSQLYFDSDGNIIERADDFGVLFNDQGEAFNLRNGQGVWGGFQNAELISTPVTVNAIAAGSLTINGVAVPGAIIDTGTALDNTLALESAINSVSTQTGVVAESFDSDADNIADSIRLINDNTGTTKNIELVSTDADTGFAVATHSSNTMKKFIYTNGSVNTVGWDTNLSATAQTNSNNIYYFTTTEDLRAGLQDLARNSDGLRIDRDSGTVGVQELNAATVIINSQGKYEINLPTGSAFATPTTTATTQSPSLSININSFSDAINNISANSRFTETMQSLNGLIPAGNSIRISQTINAATHASSIDVYDSLGSKHTVRFEFRKIGFTTDGGTQWKMIASVEEPAEINTVAPLNYLEGQITFGDDGSLSSFTPGNLTFTANNGSSPNQNINLNFGTTGNFDGMTSFDAASNTSGISQDGYPGGDLSGIRVDETGTLIGSFTNGRSFGLAQVAMAKFTNNEGLESDGGNAFIQTSNSGDPIIGQAAVGGRGFIQASSLEMSNVDLSRSLTQLIIIQRGYQANSKTITTSDQMLNTLLQLKQ